MEAKLHRIRSGSMLGGVCTGLAHYLKVDVTLVRVVFILLAILPGFGVLLYLALWFLLPTEDSVSAGYSAQDMSDRGRQFGREVSDVFTHRRENTIRLLGIGLVLLGGLALIRVFVPGIFDWIDRLSGPAFLILMGGALLYLAFKGKQS